MADKEKQPKAEANAAPKPAKDAKPAKEGAAKKDKGEAKGAKGKAAASVAGYTARLRKHYDDVVRPEMVKQFGYKNALEVPRVDKIVLNMGVGESTADSKKASVAAADLALIAGQKPVITKARKAISTFKVREGMPIGAKVTLRKTRMYEFMDRLVTIALPRVRDFRGLSVKSFDGNGNFAIGIKEHSVFPEINYDKTESTWGMDVVVCTTAKTDDEARALLKLFNFPFRQ